MKMWSSQLWLRFKQSQIKPEKCLRGFNGIRTRGLCVMTRAIRAWAINQREKKKHGP